MLTYNTPDLKRLYFFLAFFLFTFPSFGQQWLPVGPDDHGVASFGSSSSQGIVVDNNGVPYIVCTNNIYANKKISVRKYNGTLWEHVGGEFVSDGNASQACIVKNSADILYVAYIDSINGAKASVKRFNGTNWVYVGTPGLSDGAVLMPTIGIDGANNIYVAYRDYTNNGITVKKFDGTNWINVGSPGSINGLPTLCLAFSSGGMPYISFSDNAVSNKVSVKKFDGINWVYVGAPAISVGYVDCAGLAIDNNDIPHLGYYTSTDLVIKKFDGSNWVSVGAPVGVIQPSYAVTIIFDNSNVPYASYMGSGNHIVKFDGTNWVSVGGDCADYSSGNDGYLALTLSNANVPYVTFSCWELYSRAVVKRFNGTSWERLGPEGFDLIDEIAMDASDTPFIFTVSDSAVRKFNGTTWSSLGSAPISMGPTQHMALDTNTNVPYIAYRNKFGDTGACVVKHNGINWSVVGTLDFSAGKVGGIEIDIDGNGVPYVVFGDFTVNNRATVMKFNGTSWVNVGLPGISQGGVSPDIAIDHNNVPYISYMDPSIGWGVCVKKFNGTSWVDVGIPNLSVSYAQTTQLAFDAANVPYVLYEDYPGFGLTYRPTVKKFDGINWVNVGNDKFLPNGISWPDLIIHKSGTPFVILQEHTDRRARVFMFNGINWVQAGEDVSAGFAELNSITCNNNVLMAAFNSSSLYRSGFVRKYDVMPAITLHPPNQSICTGGNTAFTVITTGVTQFQWQVNPGTGWVNVVNNTVYSGATIATLSITGAGIGLNGYLYRCVMSLDGNSTVTSNAATLSVASNVTPVVTIAVTPNDTICVGTQLTFVASCNISGTSPQYQWKKNGTAITGATSSIYYMIATNDNDTITCEISSTLPCIGSSSVISNEIILSVGGTVMPIVTIGLNSNSVCAGDTATFTATVVNGGNNFVYQWKKNGINVGTNSPVLSTPITVNNTQIKCEVVVDIPCVSDTFSNQVNITMVSQGAEPALIAYANVPYACQGDTITFETFGYLLGNSPQYQWLLNGVNIPGANAATYTTPALSPGDSLACFVTSNASCLSVDTTTSPAVSIVIDPSGQPIVNISANPGTTITQGTNVVFTANCSNCGINETYQWSLNGTNIPGANADNYSSSTLNNNDVISVFVESNSPCAQPDTATSNVLLMTVTTGITDYNKAGEVIALYPNPGKGSFELSIRSGSFISGMADLKVTNALGQTVHRQQQEVAGKEVKIPFTLDNKIVNGVYFLEVSVEGKTFNVPFVLER